MQIAVVELLRYSSRARKKNTRKLIIASQSTTPDEMWMKWNVEAFNEIIHHQRERTEYKVALINAVAGASDNKKEN